jgi:hypothetical protein
MRDLLDFILANFIPVIMVVFIVLRIIGGIKSGARKNPQAPVFDSAEDPEPEEEEEEYAGAWERLKPDGESPPDLTRDRSSAGYAGSTGAGQGLFPPPSPEARPLLMPALSPRPGPPPVSSPLFSPPVPPPLSPVPLPPEVLPPEPEAPGDPKQRAAEGESPAPVFRRIEKLSPLRRAVILAEILGPPRGA